MFCNSSGQRCPGLPQGTVYGTRDQMGLMACKESALNPVTDATSIDGQSEAGLTLIPEPAPWKPFLHGFPHKLPPLLLNVFLCWGRVSSVPLYLKVSSSAGSALASAPPTRPRSSCACTSLSPSLESRGPVGRPRHGAYVSADRLGRQDRKDGARQAGESPPYLAAEEVHHQLQGAVDLGGQR